MFSTKIPFRIKNWGGEMKLCFEMQDKSVVFQQSNWQENQLKSDLNQHFRANTYFLPYLTP